MENILALGFDFSVEKFASPLVIIGIILMLSAIFFVAGAEKLDIKIRQRKKSHRTKGGDSSIATDALDRDSMSHTAIDSSSQGEETKEESTKCDSVECLNDNDANVESGIWRHEDGTFNYYLVFKILGLVLVVVSALLIVLGMK